MKEKKSSGVKNFAAGKKFYFYFLKQKTMKLPVIALGVATTVASLGSASAFYDGDQSSPQEGQRKERRGGHKHFKFREDVNHSVEISGNSKIMTVTTDNDEILEKLHERADKEHTPRNENVSVSVVKLSNGIQITHTTDDEELLAKWQDREKKKALRDTMTRTVENTENGVKITIISENAEAVEHLQSQDVRPPRDEAITKTRTNITNGVVIEISSEDESLVERIQNRAEKGKGGKRGMGKFRKGGRGFGKGRLEQSNQ